MLFVVIGVGSVLSGGELDHSFTPARLLVVGTAFGYAIVVLAYSSAAISGAHFNPAVTFALVITRKIGVVRGIFYFAAQVCGGIAGAFLIRAAIPSAAQGEGMSSLFLVCRKAVTNNVPVRVACVVGATKITPNVSISEAFLLEFILTFILVWTVFATAVDPKQGNGQFACFAIGLAVFLCHLTGVPFTGCGINPARSFGSALASGIFTDHWVYWVAPLLGGACASLLYQLAFLVTEWPACMYVAALCAAVDVFADGGDVFTGSAAVVVRARLSVWSPISCARRRRRSASPLSVSWTRCQRARRSNLCSAAEKLAVCCVLCVVV